LRRINSYKREEGSVARQQSHKLKRGEDSARMEVSMENAGAIQDSHVFVEALEAFDADE
jgi:hypothetical protein